MFKFIILTGIIVLFSILYFFGKQNDKKNDK